MWSRGQDAPRLVISVSTSTGNSDQGSQQGRAGGV